MGVLAPAALALGLLAVPVVLLYLLRLRRRTQPISSTLLWQQVTEDRAANAPWQRLRRNWLLLLQLLLLAALVVALARPFLLSSNLVQGNVIVLLDASASMLATDGVQGATRFDEAVGETSRLIDGLAGSSSMTILEVGPRPRVLAAATGDKTTLQQGLATAQPYAAAADWEAALALANGLAQNASRPEHILITDGGLPDGLPDLIGSVRHIPVGSQTANSAITTLALRPSGSGQVLLAAVSNLGSESQPVRLDLFLDGALYDARRLVLEPGARSNLTWNELPPGSVVEARLEHPEGTADFLAVDDQAWAGSPAAVDRQVLLVSDGNLFLEQLLRLLPGMTVETSSPEDAATLSTGTPYDIIVYDGVELPDALPDASVLVVNPQPRDGVEVDALSEDTIQVGGVFTNTVTTRLADDPLLQFVEWEGVSIQSAREVEASWLEPIIEAQGGPLLLSGERDGRRAVVMPFDLTASDLPLRIAFPVIMANITGWLSPGQSLSRETLAPGEPVSITPDVAATRIEIAGPNGIEWSTDLDGGVPPLFVPDAPGVYTLRQVGSDGLQLSSEQFAVSFQAFGESSIAPNPTVQLAQDASSNFGTELAGQRELWPWLLAAGLLLLVLEWWFSHPTRRPRRPVGSR